MFGKIRDKLKSVFQKTEEVIEEEPITEVEEIVEEKPEKPKKESKSKKKEKNLPKENSKKANKSKKKSEEPASEPVSEVVEDEVNSEEEPQEEKKGFFSKIFKKKEETEVEVLSEQEEQAEESIPKLETSKEEPKKKEGFMSSLKKKKITEEEYEKIWVELEVFLLEINVAYEIVESIGSKLKEELIGNSYDRFKLSEKVREVMTNEVEAVLKLREGHFLNDLKVLKEEGEPIKILILGVNGTGKTTSLAKLVSYFKKNKLSVVLAAADTFRAAATEQLEEHAKKLDTKVIIHKGKNSDPAAVAYDAIEHAKAKNLDIVLIDTAGRMPNNSNLMMELQKIKRVSNANLILFIGDSISGNDLIDQIELFDKGLTINGVMLTKVDTDERPGSIVTTAYAIDKPIYFLGIGQTYDDLIEFDAKTIAKKLFEL